MVYLCLPTLTRPNVLVHISCVTMSLPPVTANLKLNACRVNSIQCLNAFSHSCCCTHTHRHAGWQTVNLLNSVRSNSMLSVCTTSSMKNEPCLQPVNENYYSLLDFLKFISVSFTYRDCIDYALWVSTVISITPSVQNLISIKGKGYLNEN